MLSRSGSTTSPGDCYEIVTWSCAGVRRDNKGRGSEARGIENHARRVERCCRPIRNRRRDKRRQLYGFGKTSWSQEEDCGDLGGTGKHLEEGGRRKHGKGRSHMYGNSD